MAPEVIRRKLAFLRQVLDDLAHYRDATIDEIQADHYAVERMLELLVMTATDLLLHLLAERNLQPDSYRATFLLAAEGNLLPQDLADRLADDAGMRNVIVHMYESIDYTILAHSVNPALDDFTDFIAVLAPLAEHDRDE